MNCIGNTKVENAGQQKMNKKCQTKKIKGSITAGKREVLGKNEFS